MTKTDAQLIADAIIAASKKQSRDRWVPIEDVASSDYLGKGWSRTTCIKWINSGHWVEGEHWRDERFPDSKHSILKINVDAVNQYLSER